jgi:hypothetical protein
LINLGEDVFVPDFLDEKRDEIDKRLTELEPLVAEYSRLRAAAAALAKVDGYSETELPIAPTPREPRQSFTDDRLASAVAEPDMGPVAMADAMATSLTVSEQVQPKHLALAKPIDSTAASDPAAVGDPTATSPVQSQGSATPVRRAGRPKGSGTRAAEALRIVREHPGVTIPELADRMGIKQNYLYRVLPELVQEGKISKEGRGWHPRAV